MRKSKASTYKNFLKRPIDLVFSIFSIIMLSPLIIVIALLVKVKLGSPVLFKQKRPGLNEKIFTMYKFRTMSDDRDENGELLPDTIRLTKFGRFLRKTSLDELPELINILKGDMSLVGPRPLATVYLPYYNEREKIRHTVRPGLTGLAQINGRNNIAWEERFNYDIKYVENISLKLDAKIIFSTFIKVFKSEGVSVRGTTAIVDFHTYRQAQNKKKCNP